MVKKDAKAFWGKFLIITLSATLSDQLCKTLAIHLLSPGESVPVVGKLFQLTLVLNPGGVFGTRLGSQNFYTFISLLAIGATLWFFFKTGAKKNNNLRLGLSLILAGAVGNLIDRFRFGKVVDFLDFDFFNISIPSANLLSIKFPGFYLDRWPVFNLADSFVLIGMVLILLRLFLINQRPSGHGSDQEG